MKYRPSFIYFLSSIFSGVLLWLAWPEKGIVPLIFIAWIPILLVEQTLTVRKVKRSGLKIFGYFYLAMFTWNALTTWWIYNSTDVGSIVAVTVNSLFMAIVLQLFHLAKKNHGSLLGYFSFISFWISFEYLHYHWELSWPWLTLGNVFAVKPEWVQWYEFTGTLGGSLWILLINLLLFKLVQSFISRDLLVKIRRINMAIMGSLAVILLCIPLTFSLYLYRNHSDKGKGINVVVLQPNIDPYNEKFNGTGAEQLNKMMRLCSTVCDSTTDFVIAPETALPDGIWEERIHHDGGIQLIQKYVRSYPRLNFISGLTTFKSYSPDEKRSETARKFKDANEYYDVYNAALLIDQDDSIQLYHKSKLVPGVETMPYPQIFGFLDKFAIDLGGTSGSLGIQNQRLNFESNNGISVAPAICYESIYSEFMSGYIRKGANFIAVITNDGWWGNTPGYHQHMNYARLLALTFRKSIARSANTGISCFINQRGDVIQQSSWWKEDALKQEILANDLVTFYARHGDYIGFIASFLSTSTLIFLIIRALIQR